ncbi:MAG: 30S ribosomal protein S20 [Candidatus Calescibacterium sp.]|nr:30S ribosomal protein S20 [Candidatus Calescibacterium sp.]MCX7972077.1 30S ribosomal protein S20 [bacterium]MDW8194638.1 30S ribosomal protein S20 [Candidatus Calescibacterium sp.]
MSETVSKKQKRKLKKRKILRKVYKRTLRNKQIIKKVKVLLKNLRKAILSLNSNSSEQDKSKVEEMLRNFYKEIDKAVSKGVIHKNEAARKKSRITVLYNKQVNLSQQLVKK